jgi:hypothetical protein
MYGVNRSGALVTLDDAINRYGFTGNFNWQTFSNSPMANFQIINSILEASNFLTTKLRNPIVMSTFGKELRGNDTDTVFLGIRPVWDFDEPRIRRKNITDVFNLPQWGKFAYWLDHEAGLLKFRFHESLINHREPFYSQNLVYLSFVAGYMTIPDEIKGAVIEIAKYRLHDNSELEMMKGGSGQFKFLDYKKRLSRIFDMVRTTYKMTRKAG